MKKETGKSAQEYIQLKMIDAAKEGLLDPNKTIGQVACELGFQYPQHFVRFFKRHVGYTPQGISVAELIGAETGVPAKFSPVFPIFRNIVLYSQKMIA